MNTVNIKTNPDLNDIVTALENHALTLGIALDNASLYSEIKLHMKMYPDAAYTSALKDAHYDSAFFNAAMIQYLRTVNLQFA